MSFEESAFVILKNDKWLIDQKKAGTCVANVLKTLNNMIVSHTPTLTLKMLEQEANRQIIEAGCTATFQGYKGFPGVICLSVNNQLVHGIPSDYQLQDGDVVKFDLGATYNGAIADAAATAIYGNAKSIQHIELINVCKGALNHAIQSIKVGKQLGCIGYAISKYVASKSRFGLITKYGGHGIDKDTPHAPPFVANKAQYNEGVRIQPGMTLAIEPMIVIGEPQTKVEKDGWTVTTPGIGAHFEHSIFVDVDKVHILTEW